MIRNEVILVGPPGQGREHGIDTHDYFFLFQHVDEAPRRNGRRVGGWAHFFVLFFVLIKGATPTAMVCLSAATQTVLRLPVADPLPPSRVLLLLRVSLHRFMICGSCVVFCLFLY